MQLSPIEKARLSARLLQLRGQLTAGTLNPIEKARASSEALSIRTKLTGEIYPTAQAPDADEAARLALDDGLSDDPNSPNYRYKDTGYIAGSRKEEAAQTIRAAKSEGRMLRVSDIDFAAIEENPREAKKIIVKSNLFGVVDWAGLKAGGMEPSAGFLLDRAYAAVGKEPGEDTPKARKAYALGIETLRTRLERCSTAKDVVAVMDEIREELLGSQLTSDEAERYATLSAEYQAALVQERGLDEGQKRLYEAMNEAGATHRTAEYELQKRLKRGWKIEPEHEQAIRTAKVKADAATQAWGAELNKNREVLDALRDKRREINAEQSAIKSLAKARNLQTPESQAWLSLGEGFVKAVMFRSRAGSQAFLKHVVNGLAGDPKTWDWAEKEKTASTPKEPTQKRVTFALKVVDRFERKGGRPIQVNSTKALEQLCGFRAVQSGNWVLDDVDSGKWHVEQAAGAMMDMSDVLGIGENALGFGGRLGLAFGARGKGGKGAAMGHYEPIERVINITKMNGGGSLGHEVMHAIDNILPSILRGEEGGADEYASENPALMPEGPIRAAFTGLKRALTEGTVKLPEVIKFTPKSLATARLNLDNPRGALGQSIKNAGSAEAAVNVVDSHFAGTASAMMAKNRKTWRTLAAAYFSPEGTTEVMLNTGRAVSSFMAEARALDGAKGKEYWSEQHELAARAFQSYLEDRLSEKGQQNDYLSCLADNKYHFFPDMGMPFKPYPEGEERTRINAAFDEVFKALRDEKAFEKALANTALLDSIFGGFND